MAAVLLSCRDIAKAYSARPLFEGLCLDVTGGERVGLIGPNGAGKSTFLRIMAGTEAPDGGIRSTPRGMRLGFVSQSDAFATEARAVDVVAHNMAKDGRDLHECEAEAELALDRAGFVDPTAEVRTLSGGWRKRLAIVSEVARAPDVLLMDEPTNHLDLEGVLWLERVLTGAPFACVVASHDRWFLERVATRVVEINPRHPGGSFNAPGGYVEFLRLRDEHFAGQESRQEMLANKVRRETEWLRKQPKARTVKSQSRIDEAGRLSGELAEVSYRNSRNKAVDIDFDASGRRTNDLVVATGIAKALGGRQLFSGLDLELGPGTRLGLLGRNGSGKSTLLRMIAGEIQPDKGALKRAVELRVVVFHQDRSLLDPKKTLRKSLCPNGDTVSYRGRPIHLMAWAKRFLFQPEQLDLLVGTLSGGEQARILISLLMLQSADLLLLDEPTNDLDIPTLEVLEESLLEFPGAVVLVTHDRFMLDRVSTELLALDGKGGAAAYADYAQWQATVERAIAPVAPQRSGDRGSERRPAPRASGLSGKERRELERMEASIAEAEATAEKLQGEIDSGTLTDPQRLADACTGLAEAHKRIEDLYTRWAELENKAKT
ncbi:MAG: ABC-F family ATP-binding cassette domain-containing protein [Planctomycetes bacterium]|nr:ABC-F family ATP-binding cassette domain-containing protein [Planctomycetota bacterium]